MLKAVLFDLDGTLLPMDQDEFVREYFGLLCRKMAPLGYEPKALVKAVTLGDGMRYWRNKDTDIKRFLEALGESI